MASGRRHALLGLAGAERWVWMESALGRGECTRGCCGPVRRHMSADTGALYAPAHRPATSLPTTPPGLARCFTWNMGLGNRPGATNERPAPPPPRPRDPAAAPHRALTRLGPGKQHTLMLRDSARGSGHLQSGSTVGTSRPNPHIPRQHSAWTSVPRPSRTG